MPSSLVTTGNFDRKFVQEAKQNTAGTVLQMNKAQIIGLKQLLGVETENYEIDAKGFENTFRAVGFGRAADEHRRSF